MHFLISRLFQYAFANNTMTSLLRMKDLNSFFNPLPSSALAKNFFPEITRLARKANTDILDVVSRPVRTQYLLKYFLDYYFTRVQASGSREHRDGREFS
ncbi:hypothetical protein CEXT_490541 [Caerostris extrusa]|uniref:Maturase K n=1 Tax=Caerostris extrusa TaxID=172846 RepID=A0AAV4MRH3_CAEEX|nr:hypothetical protein CEXT_490541 [Caerostris extrusa]